VIEGSHFAMGKGEPIHTENSFKYGRATLAYVAGRQLDTDRRLDGRPSTLPNYSCGRGSPPAGP
jgi:hypothetical protein